MQQIFSVISFCQLSGDTLSLMRVLGIINGSSQHLFMIVLSIHICHVIKILS